MLKSTQFFFQVFVMFTMIMAQPAVWGKSNDSRSHYDENKTRHRNGNNADHEKEHEREKHKNERGKRHHPNTVRDVSAIQLDIAKVLACTSDTQCVLVNNNLSLDWLELVNNPETKQLSHLFLPPNTKQLRFILKNDSFVTVDGEVYPLVVPSGHQTGIKVLFTFPTMTAGFIESLQLDFDQQAMLAQKKHKNLPVYTMKPLVKAVNARVDTISAQDHPSVLAMPDKKSYLNIGSDFEMEIPAGAVTEPTLISVEEKKYFYETPDPVTGQLVLKPMLASNYDLQPDGAQFAKPLQVSMRYYPEALVRLGKTEADLTVLHDGVNIPSSVDTKIQNVSAQIAHFSSVTISPYKYRICDGGTTDTQKTIKCSELVDEDNDKVSIRYHLASIDRKALKDRYQLRVLADGNGPFTTQTVETLAKNNSAIVAINGSLFDADKSVPDACDGLIPKCYKESTPGVSSETVNVINGDKKTGLEIKPKQQVFKLGGTTESGIPIEMEFFDSETIFNTTLASKDSLGIKSPFYHAIGSTTAILDPARPSALDASNICRYEYSKAFFGGQYVTPLEKGEDEVTALGYSDNTIVMLVSDFLQGAGKFQTYQQLCTVFKDNGIDHAAQMDGGGSSQLVIDGKTVNTSTPRHVANAIGLVSAISPYDGQKNIPVSGFNFTWPATGDDSTYRIVISQDKGFSGFVDQGSNSYCVNTCDTKRTQETSYWKNEFRCEGHTYYWKIRSTNTATGTTPWSDTYSFKTEGETDTCPSAVDTFVSAWNNKFVEFNNDKYLYQCVDLMRQYAKEVLGYLDGGYSVLPQGNAYNIFVNTTSSKFTKIYNTPSAVPQKGDIIFWYPSKANGQAGHVAIFLSGDASSFTSFDQNWPIGSAAHQQLHNYSGVVGWLHPNL